MSNHEYEQLHGNNQVSNQPNFSEKRGSYLSIGWGVTNNKFLESILPNVNPSHNMNTGRGSSLEHHRYSVANSPTKVDNYSIDYSLSPNRERENSQNRNSFLKQIDQEYSSTGASGFLKLNGLFSSHLNKKLNLDSEVYHSMNMVGQKRTILNKMRKSLADSPTKAKKVEGLDTSIHNKSMINNAHGRTVDNADRRTMDNSTLDSDLHKSVMYGRCSKLEKWKQFQTSRYLKNSKAKINNSYGTGSLLSRLNSKSTLPVIKFAKNRVLPAKASLQPKHSKNSVSHL